MLSKLLYLSSFLLICNISTAQVYYNPNYTKHLQKGNLPSTFGNDDFVLINLDTANKKVICHSNIEMEPYESSIKKISNGFYQNEQITLKKKSCELWHIYNVQIKKDSSVKFKLIADTSQSLSKILDSINCLFLTQYKKLKIIFNDTTVELSNVIFKQNENIEYESKNIGWYKVYTFISCNKPQTMLLINLFKRNSQFVLIQKNKNQLDIIITPEDKSDCRSIIQGYIKRN